MTPARLLSVLVSLPLAVQVSIALTLVLLGLGTWTASNMAGRAAAWLDERRVLPRAVQVARRRREWRVRVARRAPQWLIDHRAARLLAQMEPSGDDLEEADRGRR